MPPNAAAAGGAVPKKRSAKLPNKALAALQGLLAAYALEQKQDAETLDNSVESAQQPTTPKEVMSLPIC